MKNVFLILLTLISFSIQSQDTLRTTITNVIDGDTWWVKASTPSGKLKIRCAGLDTPEKMGYVTRSQPMGEEVADSVKQWLLGKEVVIVTYGTDKYGRTLGITYLDGLDVSKIELLLGWGMYRYSSGMPKSIRKDYQKSQKSAKKLKIGIWADPLVVNPSKWRTKYKRRVKMIEALED